MSAGQLQQRGVSIMSIKQMLKDAIHSSGGCEADLDLSCTRMLPLLERSSELGDRPSGQQSPPASLERAKEPLQDE